MIIRLIIVLVMVATVCSPVLATSEPKQIGKSGHWVAFHHEVRGKPVCYIAAPPIKSAGKYKKRDAVFLMITHRPKASARNVVSHVAGYVYDNKTAIVAQIGKQNFVMVPNGDTAWTPNQDTDDILTNAMRKGKTMTIIGKSARGTQTTDTYNLAGISRALELIDKACGVK